MCFAKHYLLLEEVVAVAVAASAVLQGDAKSNFLGNTYCNECSKIQRSLSLIWCPMVLVSPPDDIHINTDSKFTIALEEKFNFF